MQKADIERSRRGKKDILQLTDWAVFFLFFLILHCFVSYHQISLLLVLRVSVSVFMRVLGNFGHGGSVGHTGGLDRTDSICISVEGGASTGTTALV